MNAYNAHNAFGMHSCIGEMADPRWLKMGARTTTIKKLRDDSYKLEIRLIVNVYFLYTDVHMGLLHGFFFKVPYDMSRE